MFRSSGAVRTLSPARFRARVLPAFDDSWDAAESGLLDSALERRRIAELETELAASGFDRAVILARDHWWSPRPRVCDGMHRSIAAMRLGIAIPTRHGFPPDTEYNHDDIYLVTAGGVDSDELLDAALTLSSFRCSAGPWIQCDVASGKVGGPVRLHLPHHPELRKLIADELRDRFAAAGFPAEVAFLETAKV